ncbi:hypothetical protein IP88_04825 [alpha proteobacterium AAP81b]|nr:hypothetical protein IP88_04825 [alpha proteobacterium AAP81b]
MTAAINVARVRQVLNEIIDPCSAAAGAPAGLDDMGIVLDVRCTPRGVVTDLHVVLGATDPHCMMTGAFMADGQRRLRSLPDVGEVIIEIDRTAIWTPARLSAAYTSRLAEHRQRRRAARLAAVATR